MVKRFRLIYSTIIVAISLLVICTSVVQANEETIFFDDFEDENISELISIKNFSSGEQGIFTNIG